MGLQRDSDVSVSPQYTINTAHPIQILDSENLAQAHIVKFLPVASEMSIPDRYTYDLTMKNR